MSNNVSKEDRSEKAGNWSFRLKNKKEIKREVMDRLVDRHKAVTGLNSSQLRFCIDGYGGGCRHHNRKVKT